MKRVFILLLLISTALFGAKGVGQAAYDFYLPKLMEQGRVSMKVYKNKVVLLNLWASWCDGCKKEMPLLDKVGAEFKQSKFRLVAINVDTKKSKGSYFVKKLSQKLGHTPMITFLYDGKKESAKAYQASAFPLSLLIKNGKIIKRYLGSFNEANEAMLVKDIRRALR